MAVTHKPKPTVHICALLLTACAVRGATTALPLPASPGVPLSVFHVDTLVADCEPWWLKPATLCKGLNVTMEWDSCRWVCRW